MNMTKMKCLAVQVAAQHTSSPLPNSQQPIKQSSFFWFSANKKSSAISDKEDIVHRVKNMEAVHLCQKLRELDPPH